MAKIDRVTAEDVTKTWQGKLKGAIPDIRSAIEKLTENPLQKAKSNKEKLKANWIKAIDEGRWDRALDKWTLEQWKAQFLNKGIPNISTGVDNATLKMNDFFKKLLEYEKAQLPAINKLSTATLEDAIKKMSEWVRTMAKFRYK